MKNNLPVVYGHEEFHLFYISDKIKNSDIIIFFQSIINCILQNIENDDAWNVAISNWLFMRKMELRCDSFMYYLRQLRGAGFIRCMATASASKIAVIGAGIGGTSCSYFLRQIFGDGIEIDIFDSGKVGGRLATVEIERKHYESGGSVIHPQNEYMVHFQKEFGLGRIFAFGNPFGIFNGSQLIFTGSNSKLVTLFRLLLQYKLDAVRLQFAIGQCLKRFLKIYTMQKNNYCYTTVRKMFSALDADLAENLNYSLRLALTKYGIENAIIDELVQAAMLCNYGQSVDIHSFVGMVSLAGMQENLWSVAEGNCTVAEKLLETSKATFHSCRILEITRQVNGSFSLHLASNEALNTRRDGYKSVVIACPLIADQIKLNLANLSSLEPFCSPYHTTTTTFVSGILRKHHPWSNRPDFVKTILVSDVDFPIASLAKVNPLGKDDDLERQIGNYDMYKLFSRDFLTPEQLNIVFEQFSYHTAVPWLAYPEYAGHSTDCSFILTDGLYYINAIENAASAMEMSCIGAKNVALLLASHWNGNLTKVDSSSKRTADSELTREEFERDDEPRASEEQSSGPMAKASAEVIRKRLIKKVSRRSAANAEFTGSNPFKNFTGFTNPEGYLKSKEPPVMPTPVSDPSNLEPVIEEPNIIISNIHKELSCSTVKLVQNDSELQMKQKSALANVQALNSKWLMAMCEHFEKMPFLDFSKVAFDYIKEMRILIDICVALGIQLREENQTLPKEQTADVDSPSSFKHLSEILKPKDTSNVILPEPKKFASVEEEKSDKQKCMVKIYKVALPERSEANQQMNTLKLKETGAGKGLPFPVKLSQEIISEGASQKRLFKIEQGIELIIGEKIVARKEENLTTEKKTDENSSSKSENCAKESENSPSAALSVKNFSFNIKSTTTASSSFGTTFGGALCDQLNKEVSAPASASKLSFAFPSVSTSSPLAKPNLHFSSPTIAAAFGVTTTTTATTSTTTTTATTTTTVGSSLLMNLPQFSFLTGNATSSTSKGQFNLFQFNQSNTATATTTPSVFGGFAAASSEQEDDEKYEPPKVESVQVEEEGSVYSEKCKLYFKQDKEFVLKGIGFVYLKPNDNGKVQLIIRDNTALGNLYLNIFLDELTPCQKISKNKIMLAAVPNPPIEGKSEDEAVTYLINMKSEKEADTLFDLINEAKAGVEKLKPS
ncbi:Prenylcysteine oxidase [Trichinella zimbabwensis]|uniref:Prenylcysteine oxidase n=1 Tax=Trichinella zimbabwensis TaxID=268475 RepID=A0A0V1I7E5_9BILA|nr:Prenylcysteine oxidase [Trichinella zimbabwensis]